MSWIKITFLRFGLLLSLLFTAPTLADSVSIGDSLPPVEVTKAGEVLLAANQQEASFKPWSSQHLQGKTYLIQALAARNSAKKQNEPLFAALKKANFSKKHLQIIHIVNQNDAWWGTTSFIQSAIIEAKQNNPNYDIVLDEQGKVATLWGLPEKNSSIIILDRWGKVRFYQTGALSDAEIRLVISLIQLSL